MPKLRIKIEEGRFRRALANGLVLDSSLINNILKGKSVDCRYQPEINRQLKKWGVNEGADYEWKEK